MTRRTDALAQVYARSLYELADEAGGRDKIMEVAQELEQVCELGRADRTFAAFLASPIVNRVRRGAALGRIFHGTVTDLMLRFLLVLNDRGRLGHLEPIGDAYDQLVHEAFGRVEVDVYTPAPVERGQLDVLKQRIRTALRKEPVLRPARGRVRLQPAPPHAAEAAGRRGHGPPRPDGAHHRRRRHAMTGPLRSLGLLGTACLWLWTAPAAGLAGAEPTGKLEDAPKLTVRGEAELRKPADLLRLQVGVITEDPEATAAVTRNSRVMADVIKALDKAGLQEQEYETGRFGVRPDYERRPRNAGADWEPKIIGYEVTNTLAIRTKQLDLAGKLIEAANEAGANTIDSITFDLADARTHRAEAIATATANARADAGVLAAAAGLQLVRIISVTLDEAGWRPPTMTRAGRGMAQAQAAPPLEPGAVTVRASVTLVYEVRPAEP
jgi:uncharacterized protein YggE/F0F1-type ATP synthase delta subunit